MPVSVDDVRRQFEASEIDWRAARALLENRPKPWTTTAWKKRRAKILKSSCEVCGSPENLVIQHSWHPPIFQQLCELAKPILRIKYASDHPLTLTAQNSFDPASVPAPEMIVRQCCPSCQSVAIRYLKISNNWICDGRTNKKACRHIFMTPSERLWSRWTHADLIRQAETRHRRLNRDAENTWERQFRLNFSDRICHEAMRLWFSVHARYVELLDEDVSTRCKRCAFTEDSAYINIPGWIGKLVGQELERLRRRDGNS